MILLAVVFIETSILIIIAAFLKYFIFEDANGRHNRVKVNDKKLKKKKSRVLRGPPPLSASSILAKTFYNTTSHRAETLDWFNVLVAQAFSQFRDDAQAKDAILISLDAIMNGDRKPDFLGPIKITEINMGEEFPIFSNCRVGLTEEQRLQASMDVDLSDTITLAIETTILLNYPSPAFVTLPIGLGVTIARFAGTLSIAFIPPAEKVTSSTMTFTLENDFALELSVRSLIGSRSRLQDVPKISQLVESRLRQWLCERVVEPRYQKVDIPSMWPSKARTNASDGRPVDDHGSDLPAEVLNTVAREVSSSSNPNLTVRRRKTPV